MIKPLFLLLFCFFFTACGTQDSSGLQVNEREPNKPKTVTFVREGTLNFNSEKKQFQEANGTIDLRLAWAGFGPGISTSVRFTFASEGSVSLQKPLNHGESKIFRDASGTLDVRPDEPYFSRCNFEMSASLSQNVGLSVFAIKSDAGVTRGSEHTLEVAALDEPVAVFEGDTLQLLEERCKETFEKKVRAQLDRDLKIALKTQLVINTHGDQHIEALKYVLKGKEYDLTFQMKRWRLSPVEIDDVGNSIIVRGTITELGLLQHEAHAFEFEYLKSTNLVLQRTSFSPRGVDQGSQIALRLAGYVARNSASWKLAEISKSVYVIDTMLLDSIR